MEKLTPLAIKTRMELIPGWEYKDDAIQKSFRFKDFREALSTMIRIGFECEAQNHHPEWENVYNRLSIRLTTHDADGVTEKDIELAKSIDRIMDDL